MDTQKRNPAKIFLIAGACLGFTGVLAGAFGSHALKNVLSERALEAYKTAVAYQFYHALFLIAVSVLLLLKDKRLFSQKLLVVSGMSALVGAVLFSGSIYVLVLTEVKLLGPVTPVGGLFLIFAWLALLAASFKKG